MASVHQALVSLAQMRGVLAYPDFIGNDMAGSDGLRQESGMLPDTFARCMNDKLVVCE